MTDKSINPDDPNFDAGLATLYHGLRDKFPGIKLEEQDYDEEEAGLDEEEEEDDEIAPDVQNNPVPREYRD